MAATLERVIDLAEYVTSPLGLSVVDARLSQQGKQRTIEVTIHRVGGRISLDDCESVSRELEKLLDEQDPPVVEGNYLLEVQSPGIDRKLSSDREYKLFAGEPVEVLLKKPVAGLGAQFRGRLDHFGDRHLLIAEPQVVATSAKRKKKAAAEGEETVIPDKVQIDTANITYVRRVAE